ncbi:mitochondrial carrier [Aaosphaeria arxii CBS 175.79]|uniref:Mitochondrial carrier n=1 Tax=Aaosphaeria arxii CBS 175.79 TaxID=1450172 RepID=A0A6A5XTK8_9PLEO|nr:mitochondrial carrier [Aaosphaeria arxii CBS 175.79]KAF2016685.1 mitochondrial carrier [Aaosphaeria arxii CBS 175.79]
MSESQATKTAQEKLAESTQSVPSSTAAQQSDNVAHALAGAGGGLLSMALTYPLITLSTRAQVESKRAQSSTLNAARRIIKREGIVGLYAGLESALFGISVTNFVYYYWYEWTRAFFEKAALKSGRASRKLTTVESMIAGAIAGSATVLLTNPIWVVNTRMTARKSESEEQVLPGAKPAKAPSTLGTLFSIIREEGFSRLFAGVMPALVLVINPILQYTVFEQLKNMLEKKRRVTPKDAFYLGALGKLLATSITYPYITVKSRMHVAGKDGPKDDMITSFRKIIKEEGYAGLYGGIGPKVTQSVITAAFLFAFKDALYAYTVNARRKIAFRKA